VNRTVIKLPHQCCCVSLDLEWVPLPPLHRSLHLQGNIKKKNTHTHKHRKLNIHYKCIDHELPDWCLSDFGLHPDWLKPQSQLGTNPPIDLRISRSLAILSASFSPPLDMFWPTSPSDNGQSKHKSHDEWV